VFCLSLAGAVWLALNPRWIKIEFVQLDLAARARDQQLLFERIQTSLTPQFQNLAGKFFWEVPLSKVFELVNKDKRVRKVSVYREFPSKLRVEIEPQTPVLAYLGEDNRVYPSLPTQLFCRPYRLQNYLICQSYAAMILKMSKSKRGRPRFDRQNPRHQ